MRRRSSSGRKTDSSVHGCRARATPAFDSPAHARTQRADDALTLLAAMATFTRGMTSPAMSSIERLGRPFRTRRKNCIAFALRTKAPYIGGTPRVRLCRRHARGHRPRPD